MKKNILILTGSPRIGGNSDLLAEAFAKGAACSFHDDFNLLAPMLEEADALILASPIYWFSFPSEIKAAIDKLYAFLIGGKPLKIKECMLLTCGETGDTADFA